MKSELIMYDGIFTKYTLHRVGPVKNRHSFCKWRTSLQEHKKGDITKEKAKIAIDEYFGEDDISRYRDK